MPLTITIQPKEFYDEVKNRFINVKETELTLEHSLISISKWESKYKKPFLVEHSIASPEELMYYVQCMTISPQKPDPMLYYALSEENMNDIMKYINDPMTATWFSEDKLENGKKKRHKKEILTNEVIYWQMSALEIPWQCEKWHLNRLLTLIRVASLKNEEAYGDKNNKPNKNEILKRNAALNAQRKAKLHTKG